MKKQAFIVCFAAAGLAAVSLFTVYRAGQTAESNGSPTLEGRDAPTEAAFKAAPVTEPLDREPVDPDAFSQTMASPVLQAAAVAPAATPRPIIIRSAVGNQPETLVIESTDPSQAPVEVVIRDRRMLPFALQGQTNPDLPAPIRTALDNIAGEFADNLLTAVEAGNTQGSSELGGTTSETSEGITSTPPSGGTSSNAGVGTSAPGAARTLPEDTLRSARDVADQRYRALFGDAAFNQAGLQRAIDHATAQAGAR